MENKPRFTPDPNLKLMDQIRQVLRYYHCTYRAEQTYCDWVVRYVNFHGAKTHPKDLGKAQVEAFLSHLATRDKVTAATQRQALNAIVFLYRDVLLKPIESQVTLIRAKRHPRVPVVMTRVEVKRVLSFMSRTHLLMARLLYGSGLQLIECVRPMSCPTNTPMPAGITAGNMCSPPKTAPLIRAPALCAATM